MSKFGCLVTGGAGFIGSHVAERLVHDGHRVRVVDNLSTGSEANLTHLRNDLEFMLGDLRDPLVCNRAVEGTELVFHLAAMPSVPRSMEDPRGCHEHNVDATVNLVLAGRDAGARRVVFSSSSSVYGDNPALPKVESAELQPKSPYAAAKLAGEQYVVALARAGMIEGVALRYFNIFGARQSPTSAYAAVVPVFMAAALAGTAAPIHGDGQQTRDFTYIDNAVSANLLAATGAADQVSGRICNVGAGQRTSLLELVEQIGEVTGRPLQVEHLPSRAGDVRDSLASLDRASAVLGYQPLVSLREGLERTWAWFAPSAGAAPTS
ncbi:MAG: NAD-dependent epimerase/dehydratase family protein [Gemmatimonadota bacterium]|nr:NAD-dependent epimerase/dehydratase family protein [Gemmatimonadota bacterium]